MTRERDILAAKKPFLTVRSNVLKAIRRFFEDCGFIEVQTPVLTRAPAPEEHIDAISVGDWFLSTSPELYMKRLLAAGYERIFQIAPVFRRGERGKLHHPEFTLLEWYRLHSDYEALKIDCKDLLQRVCKAVVGPGKLRRHANRLEATGDWEHLTVREAFRRHADWDPVATPDPARFDLDLVEKVEPHLGFPCPCILTDYPLFQAALARKKPGNPSVAERFELYWAGIELANGFSELNDPHEQRQRFLQTIEARKRADRSPYPLAEEFLASLDHLAPCAGIALGVDRLTMLLTEAEELDQVVAFPPEMA